MGPFPGPRAWGSCLTVENGVPELVCNGWRIGARGKTPSERRSSGVESAVGDGETQGNASRLRAVHVGRAMGVHGETSSAARLRIGHVQ